MLVGRREEKNEHTVTKGASELFTHTLTQAEKFSVAFI